MGNHRVSSSHQNLSNKKSIIIIREKDDAFNMFKLPLQREGDSKKTVKKPLFLKRLHIICKIIIHSYRGYVLSLPERCV